MKARNSPPLDSPAAYFKWALKQPLDLKPPHPAKAEGISQESTDKNAIATAASRSKADEALAFFDGLEAVKQEEIIERFRATAGGRAIYRITKRSDGQMARRTMASWLAKSLAAKV